jgi:hypothetical protein
VWLASGIAFAVAYLVRVLALWYVWEEPLSREPAGVYIHSDGRPRLGRKLKGKSHASCATWGCSWSRRPQLRRKTGRPVTIASRG